MVFYTALFSDSLQLQMDIIVYPVRKPVACLPVGRRATGIKINSFLSEHGVYCPM
jgi:hypothetical protein